MSFEQFPPREQTTWLTHRLSRQISPAAQAFAQRPQFLASLRRSTQVVPQSDSRLLHVLSTQMFSTQLWPGSQHLSPQQVPRGQQSFGLSLQHS